MNEPTREDLEESIEILKADLAATDLDPRRAYWLSWCDQKKAEFKHHPEIVNELPDDMREWARELMASEV